MDKLLTVDELADLLQVPKSWIYERTRFNELPIVPNLGKYIRFDPRVITRWFSQSSLANELKQRVKS